MKAVVFYEHGGPEVLRVEDVPVPEIAPDDVLMRVRAVSINRTLHRRADLGGHLADPLAAHPRRRPGR